MSAWVQVKLEFGTSEDVETLIYVSRFYAYVSMLEYRIKNKLFMKKFKEMTMEAGIHFFFK